MTNLTATLLNQVETGLANNEMQDLFIMSYVDYVSDNVDEYSATYNQIIDAINANKFILLDMDHESLYFLLSYGVYDNQYYLTFSPNDFWNNEGYNSIDLYTSSASSTEWTIQHEELTPTPIGEPV